MDFLGENSNEKRTSWNRIRKNSHRNSKAVWKIGAREQYFLDSQRENPSLPRFLSEYTVFKRLALLD